MLGGNAYLLEQVGFGHTSLAQASTCTTGVVLNYLSSSTVGVIFMQAGWAFMLTGPTIFSFRMDAVRNAQLIPTIFSLL